MGLDIVELVMDIEKAFGVQIADADVKDVATVGTLYDFVGKQIAANLISPTGGPYAGVLSERYLDVVEKSTGVRRARLRADARFIEDLGLS